MFIVIALTVLLTGAAAVATTRALFIDGYRRIPTRHYPSH